MEKHWISSTRLWLCLTSAAHHGTSRRPLSSGDLVSHCNTGVPSPTMHGDVQMSARKSFIFCLRLHLLPKLFVWLCAKKETYTERLATGRKDPMVHGRAMETIIATLAVDRVAGRLSEVVMGEKMSVGCIWCLYHCSEGNQVIVTSRLVFRKPT